MSREKAREHFSFFQGEDDFWSWYKRGHLLSRPRRDGHSIVQGEAEAVDVVIHQKHAAHGATQPPEILYAQTTVPDARLPIEALREQLVVRVEEVDNGIGVRFTRSGPHDQLIIWWEQFRREGHERHMRERPSIQHVATPGIGASVRHCGLPLWLFRIEHSTIDFCKLSER